MAYILGWKDILRPIRDGYRHLFPSPDTDPTPEERERQRQIDRLKGFTYFDTFKQLEAWTRADSDPIQRANTPLVSRSQSSNVDAKQKANVLLCHDYSGNYHEYEAAHSIGVDNESYTCEYLQFVDTFVYFSHKLVCVPPPSWTNTLHRNGVQSLGTLLIESQTTDTEKLLQYRSTGPHSSHTSRFPLASTLADIAKHYGFDGWLVNIEKPFPNDVWNAQALESFLRQLKDELGPSRQLIWYDALTTDNKVIYQNALTTKNVLFANACGAILTNYCWKEPDALKSKQLALQHGLAPENVLLGVDVWAQNKSKLTSPRITYPEKGGGGTNTGLAVNKLAEIGVSAGIFAPAWSFEHFPGCGKEIERAMWDGCILPENLSCSCGDADVRHPPNRGFPISRSARQHSVGSETFFYTNFDRGFSYHGDQETKRIYHGKKTHSQLAAQSVLPCTSKTSLKDDRIENSINVLTQRLEDQIGRTSLIVKVYNVTPIGANLDESYESKLPIFRLNMPGDTSLHLTISFEHSLRLPAASAKFYLRFNNGIKYLTLEGEGIQTVQCLVALDEKPEGYSRLQEIGIHLDAQYLGEKPIRLLEIREIRIVAHTVDTVAAVCTLHNVQLKKCGEGDLKHWKLSWTYQDETNAGSVKRCLPYSDTTGPFSHFVVQIDGLDVGRAYALEHILPKMLMDELSGRKAEVGIFGVGFDGTRLAHESKMLQV